MPFLCVSESLDSGACRTSRYSRVRAWSIRIRRPYPRGEPGPAPGPHVRLVSTCTLAARVHGLSFIVAAMCCV